MNRIKGAPKPVTWTVEKVNLSKDNNTKTMSQYNGTKAFRDRNENASVFLSKYQKNDSSNR